MEVIYNTFWSEWFWLPEGTTWKDLDSTDDDKYQPQVRDLRIALYLAVFVFLIRKFLERFLFTKIGECFGIKDRVPKKAPPNSIFEKSYRKNKFPKEDSLLQLSKQTDSSVRQIERWFRVRRNQDRPSMMCRFTEAAWRFTFYFSIFVYGVAVLWNKEWFADSLLCWKGYPNLYLDREIFWYYQIEMSFYWSLLFSQFIDVKRKDFWEMFFHHLATILLMTFSWSLNFVRVGTLVLVIHDAVDYILEFAKLAKYAGFQKICDIGFATMGIVWFITRLVIYPFKVLRTTWFESSFVMGRFPSLFFFNGMLLVLLVLHAYWFKLIVIVAYDFIFKSGEEITDIRSSTEEEVSEEMDDNNTANSNHIAPPKSKSCDGNHVSPRITPTVKLNHNHHEK